jgi:hypothetical protein
MCASNMSVQTQNLMRTGPQVLKIAIAIFTVRAQSRLQSPARHGRLNLPYRLRPFLPAALLQP